MAGELLCRCHPALIKSTGKNSSVTSTNPNLHAAVKRNSIRLMQDIEIPEHYHGEVMNRCFVYLESPVETIAVKVFSMSVLANLAKTYPEIKAELVLLIEDQFPHQTAGFKSRAKKIIKQL
ncbi:MAG: hypothetical protein IPL50_17595 [Chitinophagaceae bacterium]|nr:hypothetical protein [Chitinophagaceae bacterium]